MDKLYMMDFDRKEVRLSSCYRDEDALERIRSLSPEKVTLPVVEDIFGELRFPPAPENRPYTFSSVVLSSDGKMAFSDHPQGPLIAKKNYLDPEGALADFWMLTALRAYSDAVVIGAGTLQSEPLNTSHILDRTLNKERKEYLGKVGHPLNVVVSFDGRDVPRNHMIFHVDPDEQFEVVVATSPEGGRYLRDSWDRDVYLADTVAEWEKRPRGAVSVIVTGEGLRPSEAGLMAFLRECGIMRLLVESPGYAASLLKRSMLDEYFINYSMVCAGGGITPLSRTPFTSENHPHGTLVSLSVHKSHFMYTRQILEYGVSGGKDLSEYKY